MLEQPFYLGPATVACQKRPRLEPVQFSLEDAFTVAATNGQTLFNDLQRDIRLIFRQELRTEQYGECGYAELISCRAVLAEDLDGFIQCTIGIHRRCANRAHCSR